MALNIEISGKYRLTSDSMQIIVQRKHTVDPTKSPAFDASKHSAEIREEWREWKYCGKVAQALELIAQQNVFDSDARTLVELLDEIVSFRREISDLLDG